MNKKHAFVLSFLLTGLVASDIYLFSAEYKSIREKVLVARVIDGDTFETADRTLRLVNINAPEKGSIGYGEAKAFLKSYENKTLEIVVEGKDKYRRTLAKVYTPEYLNLKMVEKGLVSKFLVNENEVKIFAEAENLAIKSKIGLWKKSPYAGCIVTSVKKKEELVILNNYCYNISIQGWKLKDESRKTYTFTNTYIKSITLHSGKGVNDADNLFWGSSTPIWNDNRDSLYLFDKEGRLVYYGAYGY